MDTVVPRPDPGSPKPSKSSVLKSFLHKRTPSGGAALPSTVQYPQPIYDSNYSLPALPNDHPHSRALMEIQSQNPQLPPQKPKEGKHSSTSADGSSSLHKRAFSSVSLKSLIGKDPSSPQKSKGKEPNSSPKKTKSSTNLANLLSRPKSSRSLHKKAMEEEEQAQKDKENRNTQEDYRRPPPIYAQYSSQYSANQPLEGQALADEIDRYTPRSYFPGNQRSFFEGEGSQPTLGRRPARPTSIHLPSSFSLGDLGRRISSGSSRSSAEIKRKISGSKRPHHERQETGVSAKAADFKHKQSDSVSTGLDTTRSHKAKFSFNIDDKDVEREFEAMLDRRDIPEDQRSKMRSLALSMKKDFIRQDWAETTGAQNGRPGTNGSDSSADATEEAEVKSKRPRSRAFTLSRGSSKDSTSPIKKQKPEVSLNNPHSRKKSSENIKEGNKSSIGAAAAAQILIAKARGQTPDDFVSYLRKVQKPEVVEVGRLHKLRLLLRNETVAWTNDFITKGGMEEIVKLLHRIMEVEWREDHEDALLHETLLCLKAMTTTNLALQHLNTIQATLFPALLAMVFDPEKKGPSEFSTRNIISSVLFTYLKSAPLSERTQRAKVLLSYLRDLEPGEAERPVEFVLDMRRPRPYRVWCTEAVNVTKEIFWTFLHNLNVVPLPGAGSGSLDYHSDPSHTSKANGSADTSDPQHIYMIQNFPPELPPLPASPYVGSVEWEATNYLASHLDLMNGILACLHTREERNELREQFRISGWERCMGGTLRTCKEKLYPWVHAGLRCWVKAAAEDGWNTHDVRCGERKEKSPSRKSPRKPVPGQAEGPPVIESAPKIEMRLDFEPKRNEVDDSWL